MIGALPEGWQYLQSFDGTRLAWRSDGPRSTVRTPVVLCNGIACSDAYWLEIVPLLSQDRRVLRWDYRGHGRSDPPLHPGEHHVSSVVSDLECLLEASGLGDVVLVGHSYGVQVVLEAASSIPDRVAGVGLIAGAPGRPLARPLGFDPANGVFPLLDTVSTTVPVLVDRLWHALWQSRLVYWGARALRGTSAAAPREVMQAYFEHVDGLDPRLLLDMFRSMQAHTAEESLDRLEVPLLALAGDADGLTPLERMTEMAVRGRGELVVFPGGSHTLPAEDPEGVVACLHDLLDRVDAERGLR